MMPQNNAEIVKALNSSEEDLLAVIGYSCSPTLYGGEPDKKKLAQAGIAWITENLEELRQLFCKNERIKLLVKENSDLANLGLAILDSFAQKTFTFPIIPVVAYLLKRGITTLCNDIWSKPSLDKTTLPS